MSVLGPRTKEKNKIVSVSGHYRLAGDIDWVSEYNLMWVVVSRPLAGGPLEHGGGSGFAWGSGGKLTGLRVRETQDCSRQLGGIVWEGHWVGRWGGDRHTFEQTQACQCLAPSGNHGCAAQESK